MQADTRTDVPARHRAGVLPAVVKGYGLMRIAIVVTEDWYLCSHRLPVVRGAVDAGDDVVVLTRVQDHAEVIAATGATLVPIPLDRSSARPLKELRALWAMVRSLRRFRPDVVHNVALKPILYGTIAGRLAGASLVVNAMAGLGDLFMTERGRGRTLLRRMVALSLAGRRTRVLVQNPDDAEVVSRLGVPPGRVDLIPGVGVALDEFTPGAPPEQPPVRVLFVGRLLQSKGVRELHEAALRLREVAPQIHIELAGDRDPANPGCIDEATLARWRLDGGLTFLGRRDDVASLLRRSHVVVLPSYREGVPKALIEAAAAGRPIVATDVPGNREVVHHGCNGLLVPAHDVDSLASAILALAADPVRREQMGRASRELAEQRFSDRSVVTATLAIYARSEAA